MTKADAPVAVSPWRTALRLVVAILFALIALRELTQEDGRSLLYWALLVTSSLAAIVSVRGLVRWYRARTQNGSRATVGG